MRHFFVSAYLRTGSEEEVYESCEPDRSDTTAGASFSAKLLRQAMQEPRRRRPTDWLILQLPCHRAYLARISTFATPGPTMKGERRELRGLEVRCFQLLQVFGIHSGGPGACEEAPGFQSEQGRARAPQLYGRREELTACLWGIRVFAEDREFITCLDYFELLQSAIN
jgi:hypothetical protein